MIATGPDPLATLLMTSSPRRPGHSTTPGQSAARATSNRRARPSTGPVTFGKYAHRLPSRAFSSCTAAPTRWTRSAKGAALWSTSPWSSLITSTPARTKVTASSASSAAVRPTGLIATLTRGRPCPAPTRARRPSMPRRGPGRASRAAAGSSTSTTLTPFIRETLPYATLTSCGSWVPTTSSGYEIDTSKRPSPASATSPTRPRSRAWSSAPPTPCGTSTVCSRAIAAAAADACASESTHRR